MFAIHEVNALLEDDREFWQLVYYPRLGSTNTETWRLFESAGSAGTVVITDDQTAGRGRGANTWLARPGLGLTFSILLQPDLAADRAGLLPIISGVAVAEALANAGLPVQLKWPNDIYLNGKKTGGILCESRISGRRLIAAVIGIGLNVNNTPGDFPPSLRQRATSLRHESGRKFQRETLLAAILNRLRSWLAQPDYGAARLVDHWQKADLLIGAIVTMNVAGTKVIGKFAGINNRGEALITAEGKTAPFASGTINEFREVE